MGTHFKTIMEVKKKKIKLENYTMTAFKVCFQKTHQGNVTLFMGSYACREMRKQPRRL